MAVNITKEVFFLVFALGTIFFATLIYLAISVLSTIPKETPKKGPERRTRRNVALRNEFYTKLEESTMQEGSQESEDESVSKAKESSSIKQRNKEHTQQVKEEARSPKVCPMDRYRKKEQKFMMREAKQKIKEEERLREEELLRVKQQEIEKREYEEYLKLKDNFTVEDEGQGEEIEQQETAKLVDFIQYLQAQKVVGFEELASRFNLKTSEVVARIKDLLSLETITGIIDDRGKFIYITDEELGRVSRFIESKGRCSISELSHSLSDLIRVCEPT